MENEKALEKAFPEVDIKKVRFFEDTKIDMSKPVEERIRESLKDDPYPDFRRSRKYPDYLVKISYSNNGTSFTDNVVTMLAELWDKKVDKNARQNKKS